MAQRPRPAHRPTESAPPHRETVQQRAKQARLKAIDFLSESEDATIPHLRKTCGDKSDDDDTSVDSDRDKEDIDAPRVAQWVDDPDPQEQTNDTPDFDGVDNDRRVGEAGPSQALRSLENDLSALPLGTLRSAQRSLAQAEALSDTESDSEDQSESSVSSSEPPAPHPTNVKHDEKPEQPSKPKNGPVKRTNKHAPVEVTSKRAVSRRRIVIDDRLPKPRDPRFMRVTGRYDPSQFKQQYDFLSGLRNDELLTLRGHVKRARRLLASSPSYLRAEREEEVKRLEHALKRAESAVNLDSRERVELEALQSAKQAEKEKRKQGKAEWWMKRSEKKELLAKARLDAIASVGGKQALKKALTKKRKKIGQKEKKMRPFPRNDGVEQSDGKRRRPAESFDSRRGKRRKVV